MIRNYFWRSLLLTSILLLSYRNPPSLHSKTFTCFTTSTKNLNYPTCIFWLSYLRHPISPVLVELSYCKQFSFPPHIPHLFYKNTANAHKNPFKICWVSYRTMLILLETNTFAFLLETSEHRAEMSYVLLQSWFFNEILSTPQWSLVLQAPSSCNCPAKLSGEVSKYSFWEISVVLPRSLRDIFRFPYGHIRSLSYWYALPTSQRISPTKICQP